MWGSFEDSQKETLSCLTWGLKQLTFFIVVVVVFFLFVLLEAIY